MFIFHQSLSFIEGKLHVFYLIAGLLLTIYLLVLFFSHDSRIGTLNWIYKCVYQANIIIPTSKVLCQLAITAINRLSTRNVVNIIFVGILLSSSNFSVSNQYRSKYVWYKFEFVKHTWRWAPSWSIWISRVRFVGFFFTITNERLL